MLIILTTIIVSWFSIAFFTIAERNFLDSIQWRKGPNATGFWGILQAFADGLKLLLKEVIIPVRSNWVLFLLAPCLSLEIAPYTRVFILFLTLWILNITHQEVLLHFDVFTKNANINIPHDVN